VHNSGLGPLAEPVAWPTWAHRTSLPEKLPPGAVHPWPLQLAAGRAARWPADIRSVAASSNDMVLEVI